MRGIKEAESRVAALKKCKGKQIQKPLCPPVMKTMQLTSSGNEDLMFEGARADCE